MTVAIAGSHLVAEVLSRGNKGKSAASSELGSIHNEDVSLTHKERLAEDNSQTSVAV
jgi:hypothetical protein